MNQLKPGDLVDYFTGGKGDQSPVRARVVEVSPEGCVSLTWPGHTGAAQANVCVYEGSDESAPCHGFCRPVKRHAPQTHARTKQ